MSHLNSLGGGANEVPVELTSEAAQFSVTLPTTLPVYVDADGVVTVATDAKITNNSAGPVKVMGCLMEVQNNWAITTDPSTANIGNKEFNFTLNSKAFGTDGTYDASDWNTIGASSFLALDYDSEVAPQKSAINESMANLIFTVDWDIDQGTVSKSLTVNTPPNKTQYEEGDTFDPTGLTFTLTMADNSTKELTADEVIITGGDGISAGTPITATYNGLSCTIIIDLPNSYAISIPDGASTTLKLGQTLQLNAIATYRSTGTWGSNNPSVATVSPTGLVEAKSAGTARITYTNGSTTGYVDIEVINPEKSLEIKTMPNKTQYEEGDIFNSAGLTFTLTYDDGSTKELAASEVSITGGIGIRNNTPILATYNGVSCEIPITLPIRYNLTVPDGAKSVLKRGDTVQLTAIAIYRNSGTWTSSDSNIAKVTQTGLVTAVNTGTATIRYTNINTTGVIDITVLSENTGVLDKVKMKSSLRPLTGTLTFRDSTEVPATYDTSADLSTPGDGSVMAYITGQDAVIQANGGILAPEDSDSLFVSYKASNLDLAGLDTSNTNSMRYMFSGCNSLSSVNLSNLDTSKVVSMTYMFSGCSSLVNLNLGSFDTSKVTDMSHMFDGCSKLDGLSLNNFNTSKVTNMNSMFDGCSSIASFDVSSFNTSNVTDMGSMFSGFSGLVELDLSGFDTSRVTKMSLMFSSSKLKHIDLSGLDTSSVRYMTAMFSNSEITSVNLSGLNTSNVTDMSNMFDGCSGLTEIDLRSFNTSRVTNMIYMFNSCSNLISINLSSFNTAKVSDMSSMFRDCTKLPSLDLSNFSITLAGRSKYMFYGCNSLKLVYAQNDLAVSKLNTVDNNPNGISIVVKAA